ncbi:MAG: hypothetical protein IT158_00045 [Bryobacterales bacterium]|nr:hypothetical protein [Bryobacterales bacterium]
MKKWLAMLVLAALAVPFGLAAFPAQGTGQEQSQTENKKKAKKPKKEKKHKEPKSSS